MMNRIRKAMNDKGASAVEYGLLVAGIAALVVVAVFALGNTVKTTFGNVNSAVSKTTG